MFVKKDDKNDLSQETGEAIERDDIKDLRRGAMDFFDEKDLKGFDEEIPAENEKEKRG